MPDTLEEIKSPWEEERRLTCSYCARVIQWEPQYCFICQAPLCSLVHCAEGYMIPGFVQLQPLCHIHRKSWKTYYDMLANIEADRSYKVTEMLKRWRNEK